MINVLFIAYHFPPVGGAPVQRSINFVRYLLENGYRAVVITSSGNTNEEFTPQDRGLLDNIPPNIPVFRANTKEPPERRGVFRKIRKLAMLPRPFAKWWISTAIQLGKMAYQKEGAKLIYATMSPFESAWVASYLSYKFRIPWVADLRDAWALDEIQTYPTILHRKAMMAKMHNALSTAAVIIMNTPEAENQLRRNFKDFSEKQIVTITNGFNRADIQEKLFTLKREKFRIVHVGHFLTGLKKNRKINEILGGAQSGVDPSTRSPMILFEAIEKLNREIIDIYKNIELYFVGNTLNTERILIENPIFADISRFTGYLPRREALKMVRSASLLFLPMHNLPLGKRSTSIPSKLYEYMVSGRPILGAVPDGDARDFLIKSGTAFISRPDDSDQMMRILRKLYNSWKHEEIVSDPNENFLKRFERRNLAKLLSYEFDRLLSKN